MLEMHWLCYCHPYDMLDCLYLADSKHSIIMQSSYSYNHLISFNNMNNLYESNEVKNIVLW